MFLTVVVRLCWQKKFKSIVILPSERGRVWERSSDLARSENTRVLLFYRSESNPTQLNVCRSSEFVSCPFTLINRHEPSTNNHQEAAQINRKINGISSFSLARCLTTLFFQNGKKHLKQQHEQDAHRYDNRNSWRPRQSLRLKTSVASFAVCISGKTSSYNTSDAC